MGKSSISKKGAGDFNVSKLDFGAAGARTDQKGQGDGRVQVPIDRIDPDPDQVRTTFDQDAIDALAGTIRERGLLQPVVLVPQSGGRYMLRYGERRWRACKQLGHSHIDAVMDQGDASRNVAIDQYLENEQREGLNLVERVKFVAANVNDDTTTEQLAKMIGKSSSEVRRLYSLRDMPEELLAELASCSPRSAVALNKASKIDAAATLEFARSEESLTAAACDTFLKQLTGGDESNGKGQGEAGPTPEVKAPAEPMANKRKPRQSNDDGLTEIVHQGRRGVIVGGEIMVQFAGETEPRSVSF